MRLMLNVTNAEGRFNNLHVFISIRATGEGTWEEEGLSSLCTKAETSRIKLKYSGASNSDLSEPSVCVLLRPLSVTIHWRLLCVHELLKLRHWSRLWRTVSSSQTDPDAPPHVVQYAPMCFLRDDNSQRNLRSQNTVQSWTGGGVHHI